MIFIDEIQTYPKLLSLLKFLADDNKFTFIASGSLLGVTLNETPSIPMGRIHKIRMYPLDFEEFLYANGFNDFIISTLKNKFEHLESLEEPLHNKLLNLFKKYLLIGGLPLSVNSFIKDNNIYKVRQIQKETIDFYSTDAAKYDIERKLKIKRKE